jgi:DUF2909 family protein
MTVLIGLLFLGMVGSLVQAMFAMTAGPDASGRMVRALTMRIGLSLVAFGLMLVGMYFES